MWSQETLKAVSKHFTALLIQIQGYTQRIHFVYQYQPGHCWMGPQLKYNCQPHNLQRNIENHYQCKAAYKNSCQSFLYMKLLVHTKHWNDNCKDFHHTLGPWQSHSSYSILYSFDLVFVNTALQTSWCTKHIWGLSDQNSMELLQLTRCIESLEFLYILFLTLGSDTTCALDNHIVFHYFYKFHSLSWSGPTNMDCQL